MKIDDDMFKPGADVHYTKGFRDTLEAHMDYFRKSVKTRATDVNSHRATVYEGDLFGYLLETGIAPQHHWVTMRVNNFFSPYEFGVATEYLLIPDFGDMESLRQSQNASGSIAV